MLLLPIELMGQALSTGTPLIEDYYRREQLLGNIDLNFSFVSYPLFPVEAFQRENLFYPENTKADFESDIGMEKNFADNKKLIFKPLPLLWKQELTTHHPEGINDGAMIPARGYQTLISTGFFLKYKYLSIKLQPEFVYAANLDYDGFPNTREMTGLAHRLWYLYYDKVLNKIDQPERFGNYAYNMAFWGQSSIRFTYHSLSLGFSTENLWWGPGMRNSLIMSNSAPGFPHWTLNTVKPIKTGIGSFEGQLIMGTLKSSGFLPPEHTRNYDGGPAYFIPKREDDRYLNGMIISYQPKWIPGLFIGLIRSFQLYKGDQGEKLTDYLPVLSSFAEKNREGEELKFDAYNSLFFRFVWPKSHIEIYGEYGRSDYFWNARDLILQPDYSEAYILGFRKLIPLNDLKKDYLQVHFEITQLANNTSTFLREGGSWGTDAVVRDGYTNQGQLMGAGIGPGSNLQTVSLSWVKSLREFGIRMERYAHNEDFFFASVEDYRVHWVDISSTLFAHWNYRKFLFSLELKGVVSANYQWDNRFTLEAEEFWDTSYYTYNYQGVMNIVYRF